MESKSGISKYYRTQHGELFNGDCREYLRSLESNSIDMVFADPPFNLNKDYGIGISDNLTEDAYLAWCLEWLTESERVLRDGGALWIYNIPKWNLFIAQQCLSLNLQFRHWVAVDLKMNLPIANKLYPSHYSLLYFIKGKKPRVFNKVRIPIQVCRHCGGDVKDYGGHRGKIHPEGINLTDVWTDITPVRHANTKFRAANQLNEKLLERVIEISSIPGDVILDPFGGSGTTYVVAERLHRNWKGSEIGDVQPIISRLNGTRHEFQMPNRGDAGKGA
jgi:site-specific DNA-methyltransferase (adenine-specific)